MLTAIGSCGRIKSSSSRETLNGFYCAPEVVVSEVGVVAVGVVAAAPDVAGFGLLDLAFTLVK